MKRFRLSTLMLLVLIAALGLGLVVQETRHRRREAEQRARIVALQVVHDLELVMLKSQTKPLQAKQDAQARPSAVAGDGR